MSDDKTDRNDSAKPSTAGGNDKAAGKQVLLQKIYLRDASVEVPDGPQVFTREWKPEIDVDLNTRVQDVGEQTHQVSVKITITATLGDKTAYIVEVEHAGVFHASGFDNEDELRQVLGSYCPNTLFPYVREVVGDLVQRAGFPHFLLQPVNFDALYQRHVQEQRGQAQAKH